MKNIELEQIGIIGQREGMFTIELEKRYIPALEAIKGFGFLHVLWWGHLIERPAQLVLDKPYTKGPEKIGIFATRSPSRPNPVLLTTIQAVRVDYASGIIYTYYIDAEPGTPVIDIKPYHANDRVKNVQLPEWCRHWPAWYEESGEFDWQSEFNFQ